MLLMVGVLGVIFGLLLLFGMFFLNCIIVLLILLILMKVKVFVVIYGGLELIFGFNGVSGIVYFVYVGGMLGVWLLICYWCLLCCC